MAECVREVQKGGGATTREAGVPLERCGLGIPLAAPHSRQASAREKGEQIDERLDVVNRARRQGGVRGGARKQWRAALAALCLADARR